MSSIGFSCSSPSAKLSVRLPIQQRGSVIQGGITAGDLGVTWCIPAAACARMLIRHPCLFYYFLQRRWG
ncbi:hypothetical protein IWW43_005999, partial [Coemansia sp. RSA 1935]